MSDTPALTLQDLLNGIKRDAIELGETIGQLKAENAKLREQVAELDELRMKNASLKAALEGMHLIREQDKAENDKLRELVQDMLMSSQDYCEKYGIEYEGWSSADDHIDARMRELGMEVTNDRD